MIAIHDSRDNFSSRWMTYLENKNIPYKIVDCFSFDLIKELRDCRALLWHWNLNDRSAQLVARQIIRSVERMGLVVFPDDRTCWHYDDKIGQKYLLEAVGAPLVPTYIFYDLGSALKWIAKADYPKVMKLSTGASSTGVSLVPNRKAAEALCRRAFGGGFPATPSYFNDSKTKMGRIHSTRDLVSKISRMPALLWFLQTERLRGRKEWGYIYFQDFIPNNTYDTRITVIGNRAFGFRRMVRPGDFRASGSGRIDYATEKIGLSAVSIAFEVTKKIGARSLAFDFALDPKKGFQILEISYTYVSSAVAGCPGYWGLDLQWHPESVWPEDAILEDLLNELLAGSQPGCT